MQRLFIGACMCAGFLFGGSGVSVAETFVPDMIALPPGTVVMGSEDGDRAAAPDEFPRHEVALARGFRIATYPVTRGDFARFVAATGYARRGFCRVFGPYGWRDEATASWREPGFAQTDKHPAVCVSWDDAQAYIAWLNEETGEVYRLPSESEWAYAARAGSRGLNFWGDSAYDACTYANVNDLTAKNKTVKAAEPCDDGHLHTSEVGIFQPNGFGLYDIQGNVWEWAGDCWTGSYAGHPGDGSAAEGSGAYCDYRAARGGSWYDIPGPHRLEAREHRPPQARLAFVGFRLAADLVGSEE